MGTALGSAPGSCHAKAVHSRLKAVQIGRIRGGGYTTEAMPSEIKRNSNVRVQEHSLRPPLCAQQANTYLVPPRSPDHTHGMGRRKRERHLLHTEKKKEERRKRTRITRSVATTTEGLGPNGRRPSRNRNRRGSWAPGACFGSFKLRTRSSGLSERSTSRETKWNLPVPNTCEQNVFYLCRKKSETIKIYIYILLFVEEKSETRFYP